MKDIEFIKTNKIIAVVRSESFQSTLDFAEGCIEGGIKLIEVIMTSSDALGVLEKLSEKKGVMVGAGTVLDIKMARDAYKSGARFIVSPHTDSAIVKFSKSKGVVSIAGAYTSSEIVNAWNLGVDFVKIFPASVVGPDYIKALKEPLPFVEILVTGGINEKNASDYLHAGASVVGVSSVLLGKYKKINKKVIIENAQRLIKKVEV